MAYRETLSAWRKERDASLVACLVDEALLAARAHPAASRKRTTPAAFHELWMETASTGGVEATPWLALTLTSKLEVDAVGRIGAGATIPLQRWNERARALLTHAPNPVLTLAGLRVLREVELGVSTRIASFDGVYALAFELIRAGGHTNIHGEVTALIEQHEEDTHDRVVVDLVAPLRALLADLPAPASPPTPPATRALDEATLRAAVADAIDDDAPRLVYADWLAERGDPLGELIVLQCRQAREQDPAKREKLRSAAAALVAKHKALWLGALSKVLTHVELRRGFLASFALGPNHLAHEREWERLANDPLLRTVEAISPKRGNKRNYALFVGSPEAKNLRVLHHVGVSETRAIARGPERSIRALVVPKLPAPKLLAELFASRGLAKLRRIDVEPDPHRYIPVGALSALRAHLAKRPITGLASLGVKGRFQASGFLSAVEDLLAMPLETSDVTMQGLRLSMCGRGAARTLTITVDDQPCPSALPGVQLLGEQRFGEVTICSANGVDRSLAAALAAAFPRAIVGDSTAPGVV